MARPKKQDEAERLTEFHGFHVTPSMKAVIEKRALATGLHPSEYSRRVLLSDEKAPAPSARDPAAIRDLTVAITRLGNNHNQIAKHANERKNLPPELDAALLEVSRRIIAALDKVTEL